MDRLQSRSPWINLSLSRCCLCQKNSESVHVFFDCLFSGEVRFEILEAFNWSVVLPHDTKLASSLVFCGRFGTKGIQAFSKENIERQRTLLATIFIQLSIDVLIYRL
uniref:Uncharacterized protein n=1 Tax=Cucumis melo TaxID=3656 RepID=A0A9I9ELR7_CUCME